MKKGVIWLIVGFVAIIATFVFIFVVNPALSKTGKSIEEQNPETAEEILENVIFEPSTLDVEIGKGDEKTKMLGITNNDKKSLFFRCAIYNSYSSEEGAPSQSCEANEETDSGYVQRKRISSGKC